MPTGSSSQTNLCAQQTWRYLPTALPLSTDTVNETAPHLFLKCFPSRRKTPFVKGAAAEDGIAPAQELHIIFKKKHPQLWLLRNQAGQIAAWIQHVFARKNVLFYLFTYFPSCLFCTQKNKSTVLHTP